MADVNDILKDTFENVHDNTENMSNNEYFKKLKRVGIEFPSNFDIWTVQEQNDWMYHNITNIMKVYLNAPETLENLIPAVLRPIDFGRSQEKLPEWMDMDKYHKGQKFVRKNYFSLIFGILLGTIYGMTFDDGLKPIIISGQSGTPYLAFKRYLSTITRILSWYNGKPWIKGTKAYKNMQVARAKHVAITKKMSRMSNKQIIAASKIANPLHLEREIFLKDFAVACPFGKVEQRPYKVVENIFITKVINNAMISIAQGTFIILPIIYPQNIGIHDATDNDLEAFCHMWKCYGYFLGLEDEYNFCRGSLEEIKQRMYDLSQCWIQINFKDITLEWMHMSRCLVESMNYYSFTYMPYKTMILLLTEILNLEMPNLYASLNYGEWIAYYFYKFLLRHAFKFSVVRKRANRLIYKILETASNFGPETLTKLQEKSNQYLLNFSNK